MPRIALVHGIRDAIAAELIADATLAGVTITSPRLRMLAPPPAEAPDGTPAPPRKLEQLDLSTPTIDFLEKYADAPPHDLIQAIVQLDLVVRDVPLPATATSSDAAAVVLEELAVLATKAEPSFEKVLGNLESAVLHPAIGPLLKDVNFVSYAELADVEGERLHAKGSLLYGLDLIVERTFDVSSLVDLITGEIDYNLHAGGVVRPDAPHAEDEVPATP